MAQHTTYQTECPQCWRVSELRDRAEPLQAHINRELGRSYTKGASPYGLTPRQESALAWSIEMASCLRRQMDLHARCRACSVLMGPGHIEKGTEEFCATHAGGSRASSVFASSDADTLEWIAGQAAH
ncbi:MAG TPA: hypothetical protein VMR52_03365 [Dehalococcoidia bacterium]|nr:hypothetical protein [Dehalococcoidia bacterium]